MTKHPVAYPANQQPSIRRVMMPRDTNAMGTIFGGVILSEIDLAAAIEAHQYHPDKIVTIAMDQIEFRQPVFVGDLVSFFTHTVKVGRTSITVGVSVWAQRARDRTQNVHVTEAKVTMVAVDDLMKPIPISRPPVKQD
ncbi:MAG TPA: acyl-CoA thioesterase [Planctomycetota bacterium]|nr:acyl-CoA thioesterase [Planctomycetota bacterium]